MANDGQQQQQQSKQKGCQQQSSTARRKQTRKAKALFWMVVILMVIYFARITTLDASIPKIIGTVGYWFDKDWETPVRISLGTAEHLLFFVAGLASLFLSKQEEA
jgi:hypothetical protein